MREEFWSIPMNSPLAQLGKGEIDVEEYLRLTEQERVVKVRLKELTGMAARITEAESFASGKQNQRLWNILVEVNGKLWDLINGKFYFDDSLSPRNRRMIVDYCRVAHEGNGAHHDTWAVYQIAKLLGVDVDLDEYNKGIAP